MVYFFSLIQFLCYNKPSLTIGVKMSKTFSPMAFIDNNEIKISDEQGGEFNSIIKNKKEKIIKLNQNLKFVLFPTLFFFVCAASALFINLFSSSQNVFFIVMTIFFAIVTLSNRLDVNSLEMQIDFNNAKLNLSKKALQLEIMQLEKLLAEHNFKMQNIAVKDKFNFQKSQEKTLLA